MHLVCAVSVLVIRFFFFIFIRIDAHRELGASACTSMRSRGCHDVCMNDCRRAFDGRCSDGWHGDVGLEGQPSCSIGHDCNDCGVRRLCPSNGTSPLMLPEPVLSPSLASPLRPTEVLFVVLGSSHLSTRSELVHRSLCRSQPGMRCLFVSDDKANQGLQRMNKTLPLLTVHPQVPKNCCRRHKTKGSQIESQ